MQGESFSIRIARSIYGTRGFNIDGIGNGRVHFEKVEWPQNIVDFATPAGPVVYQLELNNGQVYMKKRPPAQLGFQLEFPENIATWKGNGMDRMINIFAICNGIEYVSEDPSDAIIGSRGEKFVAMVDRWSLVGEANPTLRNILLLFPPEREVLEQIKFRVELKPIQDQQI
jgi:hypothetical protein